MLGSAGHWSETIKQCVVSADIKKRKEKKETMFNQIKNI